METTNKRTNRRKKEEFDLENLLYGKVPPQAHELEEVVIGAIMLDKDAFGTVSGFLKAECFYVEAHQLIYQAFFSLALQNKPIDILTTVEELKKKEKLDLVGGAFAVTKLTNKVSSSANLETHSRIIFEKFLSRELIKLGGTLVSEGYEDSVNVQDLIDKTQTDLFNLTKGLYKRDFQEMELNVMQSIDQIEEKREREPGTLTGVPSGFKDIDNCTGGFQETDLIILAARPAVGKTALALRIARNAATHEKQAVGVAVFSLEMATSQLVNRVLSAESQILLEKIRDADLNDIEIKVLYATADKVSKFPIYIDDSPNLNIIELKGKVKRLLSATEKTKKEKKVVKGIGLIIIDYLQLMNGINDGTHKTKAEIVGEISRQLKILAKEIEVPIIALSQMSRSIETRTDKEPNLADLRESGAIEQDADIVAFLYNDSGQTKFRIAKHRNGKLARISLNSKLEIQQFSDYQAEPFSPKNKASTAGNFDEGLPEAEDEFSFSKTKK